jgi:membrane protein
VIATSPTSTRTPNGSGISDRLLKPLLAYAIASLLARRPASEHSEHLRVERVSESSLSQTGRLRTQQDTSGDAGSEETDRGRSATRPWDIPWCGWKDIVWRTYGQISEDRLLAVAAGVVFYGLLALFPALTAVVSLYGLFAQPSSINEHLTLLSGVLPGGGVEIVQEQVNRVAAKGQTNLLTFTFGFLLAIWSTNSGMKAVIDALNVSYKEKERRGFIKLNLASLALTAGAIIAVLIAIAAVIVVPLVLSYIGIGSWVQTLLSVLRWPVLLGVVIFGLAVLYRFGPSRERPRWQWISVGSIFAAAAWLLSSALLSLYLSNFANYDATYGSLGAAIGLMMWMWISAIVILLGAELNAEVEHQTARDTTTGRERPIGRRGAAMADTVGASSEGGTR